MMSQSNYIYMNIDPVGVCIIIIPDLMMQTVDYNLLQPTLLSPREDTM